MDDFNLVPVGEFDDLLVEVEEDVLRLTLAIQRLVGQAGTRVINSFRKLISELPFKCFLHGILSQINHDFH